MPRWKPGCRSAISTPAFAPQLFWRTTWSVGETRRTKARPTNTVVAASSAAITHTRAVTRIGRSRRRRMLLCHARRTVRPIHSATSAMPWKVLASALCASATILAAGSRHCTSVAPRPHRARFLGLERLEHDFGLGQVLDQRLAHGELALRRERIGPRAETLGFLG